MKPIFLDDPAWTRTFPHRVAPQPGEALVSLLLRCDEVNHWASGATCAHLGAVAHASTSLPHLIVPSSRLLEVFANLLSHPLDTIAATTYLWELQRCFGTTTPEPGDLCSWFVFHVCPACIKEQRLLLREHFLLGVTACQQHQLSLLSVCSCGTALLPFDPHRAPFTCSGCTQAWGELPHALAPVQDLKKEQQILACYCWWLRYADPTWLSDIALRLMYLDMVSERGKRHTVASPRWSEGSPRRRFHLRSSHLGPLSSLVREFDEKDLLSRYAVKE